MLRTVQSNSARQVVRLRADLADSPLSLIHGPNASGAGDLPAHWAMACNQRFSSRNITSLAWDSSVESARSDKMSFVAGARLIASGSVLIIRRSIIHRGSAV